MDCDLFTADNKIISTTAKVTGIKLEFADFKRKAIDTTDGM